MIVAIPKLNNMVAPCFEAAREFQITRIIEGKEKSKTVICIAKEGFKRVRLLHLHDVQLLICNGIKGFYRDQVIALGISVIPNINDSVENSIKRFLANELKVFESDDKSGGYYEVPHKDLKSWAKELFEANGYSVFESPDNDAFLIDLICKINCPVCNKEIKIAVCCGGHTYRPDQEIREFYNHAKTQYNARIYINLNSDNIAKNCIEYGIEFISPDKINIDKGVTPKTGIPIINGPIEGHEKLLNMQS